MSSDHSRLHAEAAHWVARLQSPECSVQERKTFERWYRESATHAKTFDQTSKLHSIAKELATDPSLRASSLAARRRGARRASTRRVLRKAVPATIAASVLFATGLALHRHTGDGGFTHHYSGALDRPSQIQLSDGTRMTLDASSAATALFDGKRRSITLESGRAQFVVAHSSVPFEVHAGPNIIRDVGTSFQVTKIGDAIIVSLLEGQVTVTHGEGMQAQFCTLAPSQQLHIAADGCNGGIQPLDVESAQAWTRGELIFRQRRLDLLLDEANRYSQTKLRLGDPSLASLLISGSIRAGDQMALVKALQTGWSIRVEAPTEHELSLYRAKTNHHYGTN